MLKGLFYTLILAVFFASTAPFMSGGYLLDLGEDKTAEETTSESSSVNFEKLDSKEFVLVSHSIPLIELSSRFFTKAVVLPTDPHLALPLRPPRA